MVGRLVEQEQVRGVKQRPGQRDPPLLAARQARDARVDAVGKAGEGHSAKEAGEDLAKRRVARPGVLGPVADEGLPDRVRGIEIGLLENEGRADVRRPRHRPAVGLLGTGDQAHERRLARSVLADDADPLTLADAEGDVLEHREAAVALGDGVEVDEIASGGDPSDVADAATGRVQTTRLSSITHTIPTTETIVSITDHDFRVSGTDIPQYWLTSQKPAWVAAKEFRPGP